MYDFIGRAKLEITHTLALAKLDRQRRREERELRHEHKFEKDVVVLEQQIELEERRAELRGLESQNVSQVQGVKKSGMLSQFQDFATNFAENQERINKNKPGGKLI